MKILWFVLVYRLMPHRRRMEGESHPQLRRHNRNSIIKRLVSRFSRGKGFSCMPATTALPPADARREGESIG
jgi:hypothetical protein